MMIEMQGAYFVLKRWNQNPAATKRQIGIWQHWKEEREDNDRPPTSERRLNFSQAFNPVGAVTGLLVGTIFIFSGIELQPAQVAVMKVEGTYDAYLRYEKPDS
jgi:hypothetical protein